MYVFSLLFFSDATTGWRINIYIMAFFAPLRDTNSL